MSLIIFDLDGVIVDACEWHRIALNEALKRICGCEITLEEHYSVFNGIPTRVKLDKLAEMGRIEATSVEGLH
jgi:beta-phosphoglucomutase-like phosphatase (HAD superfamily)